MKSDKKYVVLEHLTLPDRGFRFFTANTEDNTHGRNGELWYKEVLFTDSTKEAQEACRSLGEVPSMHELEEYYRNLLEQENEN